MTTLTRSLLQLGAFVGLLGGLGLGCGGGAGLPGIIPTLDVSSPTNNSAVNLPANKQVAVNFTTNYTIKAPGTCDSLANCGHVYVLIDNTSCNNGSLAYNNLATASPTFADFSKCATATGQHTISLELHSDSGAIVNGPLGNPITAKVTITAQ